MRFFALFCGLTGIAIVSVIALWLLQSGADEMLMRCQRVAPFSAQEMTYRSVSRALFDDKMVFYRPVFPEMPVVLKTDKLFLKASEGEIEFRFVGLHADWAKTLKARDGEKIADTLQKFDASRDFFRKPMEALVLLNRDVFSGTVRLTLLPRGKTTRFYMTVLIHGKPVLRAFGMLVGEENNDRGLWRWVNDAVQSVSVRIDDEALLKAAADYFQANREKVPFVLKESLDKKMPLEISIDPEYPVPLKSFFEKE